MERKDVIAQLLKSGATSVKNLTIKNVTVSPQQEYVRLGLTIDKEVQGYRENNGIYEETPVNVIFVSAFTIASLLKEDDNAAFAANHLLKHPDALGMILSRAKIDIIQEKVPAGTDYKNPFASEDSATTMFDHDAIINHVTSLTIGEFGNKRLERLADLMMGFAA